MDHASIATLCTACGAPLVWARNEDTGTTIPLDVRPLPTYVLVIHQGDAVAKRSPAYVSHWVTCPLSQECTQTKHADGAAQAQRWDNHPRFCFPKHTEEERP